MIEGDRGDALGAEGETDAAGGQVEEEVVIAAEINRRGEARSLAISGGKHGVATHDHGVEGKELALEEIGAADDGWRRRGGFVRGGVCAGERIARKGTERTGEDVATERGGQAVSRSGGEERFEGRWGRGSRAGRGW